MGREPARTHSAFQPIVRVQGDHVDIDWSDCHMATYVDDVEQDGLNGADSRTLDVALGFPDEQLSPADRLRRLADYIDAHPKVAADSEGPNAPRCPVCNEPGVPKVQDCPYFEDSDHNDAAVADGT
jgi:hypothetical protein